MSTPAKRKRSFDSLFEDDYLVRTLGPIAQDPAFALTELVANAWDAGASLVEITIPPAIGGTLSMVDDGHGMSAAQFEQRWMTLGYDRVEHQGADVEFPPERNDAVRRAYGRNGTGRHGLLCFADGYTVETWQSGKGSAFAIGTQNGTTPSRAEAKPAFSRPGSGTRLSVVVDRRLPEPDSIRSMLSARFLHDPQFVVRVNGLTVSFADQTGLIERSELDVPDCAPAEAFVVDATRVAKTMQSPGVAFWINGRLVGVPSWVVGSEAVIDGGARFAKRYSIIVKADDGWMSEIEPDWSRFKTGPRSDTLFRAVRHYARDMIKKLSATMIDERSEEVLVREEDRFKALSPIRRVEVAGFTQELVGAVPTIHPEALSAAVQAVIHLEQARGGAGLLEKLTRLDEADVGGLDRIFGQWSAQDALTVLDEIEHRLAVVAAIEKLSGDPAADELHTLHPLLTQARWLFGPEYDSSEYTSNISLRAATEKIFSKRAHAGAFHNDRQRPDIVVLADATVSVVGTEGFDNFEDNLCSTRNVLIIELKKGASMIDRHDTNQADGYVQDFLGSGLIDGTPMFRAFVVGHEVAPKTAREKIIMDDGVFRGRVIATTYGQLTRTAHRRLFRLKEQISPRYEDVSGADLATRVMATMARAKQKITVPDGCELTRA